MPEYKKPLWIVLDPDGVPMADNIENDTRTVLVIENEDHARRETVRWNAVYQGCRCEKATLSWGPQVARPESEWHEDIGDVLWWNFPVNEAPYVGTPLDGNWPGYHTHWTPCPEVPVEPQEAP